MILCSAIILPVNINTANVMFGCSMKDSECHHWIVKSVSHGSAYTVVRATQQVNGKWQFWGVRTP